MYNLVLNVGDKVRNINGVSRHYRCRGRVIHVSKNMYRVAYDDKGITAYYYKENA